MVPIGSDRGFRFEQVLIQCFRWQKLAAFYEHNCFVDFICRFDSKIGRTSVFHTGGSYLLSLNTSRLLIVYGTFYWKGHADRQRATGTGRLRTMNLCASIASYKRRRARMRRDPPLTIIKILLCRSLAILSHVLLQALPRSDTVVGYLKLIRYKCTCRTFHGSTTRLVDGYLLFSYVHK